MLHTLLVIDDEKMLTDLLKQYFTNMGYLVYTANDGDTAMALLNKEPDLILLDIMMDDFDGYDFCVKIRPLVNCPILFLTAKITEEDRIKGLQIGGDDYITKPFSLEELSARVEAHLRRETRTKARSSLLVTGNLVLNLSEKKALYDNQEISFSRKQFEIICFLAENEKQVFDKEKIYEAVWGMDGDGDSNTVKEHIRKIRRKLKEITGQDFIETVWGIGYKWNV
ncbi:MAG: response regulator transcription factor [Clostridiales bacterium]|nr:response regulator transcription factor [Clostridiales bacterium]